MAEGATIKGRADYSNYATKTEQKVIADQVSAVVNEVKNLLPKSKEHPVASAQYYSVTTSNDGWMYESGAANRNGIDTANCVVNLKAGKYILSYWAENEPADPYFVCSMSYLDNGEGKFFFRETSPLSEDPDIYMVSFYEWEVDVPEDRTVYVYYQLGGGFRYRAMLRHESFTDNTWAPYQMATESNVTEEVAEYTPQTDTSDAVSGTLPAPSSKVLSFFGSDGKWYTVEELCTLITGSDPDEP